MLLNLKEFLTLESLFWSQLVDMHIVEREKLFYIHGKTKPPIESDEGYEKWYANNQKVKRWLLMSMTLEIMKRYLRVPTAQEIWSACQWLSMMEVMNYMCFH